MQIYGEYYSKIFLEEGSQYTGVNFNWQGPAMTERAAYICRKKAESSRSFGGHYVGYPWASFIDVYEGGGKFSDFFLCAYSDLRNSLLRRASREQRIITVCQHIKWRDYVGLFRDIGVTDLFVPHLYDDEQCVEDITLHPFPLFPAQTHFELAQLEYNNKEITERKVCASFIGAYSEGLYLTDVREQIFNRAWPEGVLVKRRERWHFDPNVYGRQVRGDARNMTELYRQKTERDEYLKVLKDSEFSLCPTGSGPSSIRLYESFALNVIPILLTSTLRLPGNRENWQSCAVICEDSLVGLEEGISEALSKSAEEKQDMVAAGNELFQRSLAPEAFSSYMDASVISSGQERQSARISEMIEMPVTAVEAP